MKKSLLWTSLLFCLLFSECTIKPQSSGFDFNNYRSPKPSDERHYVLMKDSSRVYGDKIIFPQGIATKNKVVVDDRTIPPSEVLGFLNKEGFWAKVAGDYRMARRLIYGRISVYREIVDNPDIKERKNMLAIEGNVNDTRGYAYYFQKENGPIKKISGLDELKQMIEDCPKAYQMVNVSEDEYKKALKKDHYYTQAIIDTYNACGEWK